MLEKKSQQSLRIIAYCLERACSSHCARLTGSNQESVHLRPREVERFPLLPVSGTF